MKAQYTPGPWNADEENCGGGLNIKTKDGSHVCHTAVYRDKDRVHIQPPEAFANARLIASSPELLEVLDLAVRYLEHPDVKAIPFALPSECVANRARAIIEKVLGG